MDTVWGETRCYHPVAKSCLTFCSRDRARTRTSWLQSRVLPQQAAVFPKVPWEMVGAGREPSGVGQALVHAEDREAEPLGPEGSLQTFWFLWGCWGPSLLQGKQVIFWLAYFFDCSWVEFSNWVCQKNWCRLKMSLLLSKAGWNWEAQGKVVRRGPCRWDPALVLWLPRLLLCNLRSIPHHEHPLLSSASPLCVFCPLASSLELPPTSFKSAWPCLRNVLKAPRSLTANTEALALEGQDFPWPLRHPSPAAAPCFSSCPPTACTCRDGQTVSMRDRGHKREADGERCRDRGKERPRETPTRQFINALELYPVRKRWGEIDCQHTETRFLGGGWFRVFSHLSQKNSKLN